MKERRRYLRLNQGEKAMFDPDTDALDHGYTRGAHGQSDALRWAWIHEGDEDVMPMAK